VQWGVNDSTKPWVVWRVIEKWEVADIKVYNQLIELMIPIASQDYADGDLDFTITPKIEPVDIDVIEAGKSSGTTDLEDGVLQ
jgi:hypothetical protein